MAFPKLFLYKARDAQTMVILRRGERKSLWEMIRWDLDTDTFTRGQWLTHIPQMNGAYCAISPDGRHFAYWYTEFDTPFTTHAIISEVPYFTAVLYTNKHNSNWDTLAFSRSGQPMHSADCHLVKKNPTSLKRVAWESGVDSGYVRGGTFVDTRGRSITADKGRVLVDGHVLYDTTDHVFQGIPYKKHEQLPSTVATLVTPDPVSPLPMLRRSARLASLR